MKKWEGAGVFLHGTPMNVDANIGAQGSPNCVGGQQSLVGTRAHI